MTARTIAAAPSQADLNRDDCWTAPTIDPAIEPIGARTAITADLIADQAAPSAPDGDSRPEIAPPIAAMV
jgi:hypothetical protein